MAQGTQDPWVIATVTAGMGLIAEDAEWLQRAVQLVEVRLDAIGEGGRPLGVGEVAALVTRFRAAYAPFAPPGRPAMRMLATASTAVEAAGHCETRGEAHALLEVAVLAGVDWIDFDVAIAAGMEARLGADWAAALAHAEPVASAQLPPALASLVDERVAELEAILGANRDVRFVLSEHWTVADGAVADGLAARWRCLRALLERLAANGRWPGAVKLIQRADPAASAEFGQRASLEHLMAVPAMRRRLVELCAELAGRVPEHQEDGPFPMPGLAMFAGGATGSWTRPLCPVYGSDWVYAAAEVDRNDPVPGQWTVAKLRACWPGGQAPTARTAVFGVLGERIAGSASPALFTQLFERAGSDAVYGRFDLADAGALFERLADDGQPVRGLSVTAPHKKAAWWFGGGDHAPADSGIKGLLAYNTLTKVGNAWQGANTDVLGVRAAVEALFGGDWFAQPRSICVLGAGGAARAVLRALSDPRATAQWEPWLAAWRAGAKRLPALGAEAASTAHGHAAPELVELVVLARNPKRAMALAREFGAGFGHFDDLGMLTPDLIIHTTQAGSPASRERHHWLPGPAALAALAERAPHCRILDANYKPDPTPLVAAARQLGLSAATGKLWFWAQAAAQFQLFQAALGAQASLALPTAPELVDAEHTPGKPRILVLIGQRGAGKTALGRALAKRHNVCFRDLDEELSAAHGAASAGDLYAALGEVLFRAAEVARLENALTAAGTAEPGAPSEIWATGGGLLTTPTARAALAAARAAGLVRTLWLQAEVATLAKRVAADPVLRPPLFGADAHADPLSEATRIATVRGPLYRALADAICDTTARTPEDLAAELQLDLSAD